MTRAGLNSFKQRTEYDEEFLKVRATAEITLAPEMEKVLKSNERAWQNFSKLSPGCRKQYALWLNSAKREATKQKRLKEAIDLLEQNRKLGMK